MNLANLDLRAIPFITLPYLPYLYTRTITRNNMEWYESLKRPVFAPPRWVFPPVWVTLYASMGAASYLVWRDAQHGEAILPLTMYAGQLAFNWLWTPVFFGAHKLKQSVVVMVSTLGCVIACVGLFRPINQLASNIMIGYAVWLSYACAVNSCTAMLNS